MTVAARLKSTMAALEGILADFKTMYTESSDTSSRELLNDMIMQTEEMKNNLKNRIIYIENEEPQYKEENS